ncbi:FKBP-type peptidyl-prolyl cis-trans isomerase [Thioalkalivibrio halophilus]|uniref:peptidylprolyl isomerase n=1 Tax=Thioalkalivibrio halophilus TaxID=252474 RepID=A0A1V3A052_9GAMM|nr:FKBP-type peptidyl-prolyl cis-trans isomerase [Thioalkalivibrio halophilus]OOC10711.1 hypothetical protein B1A74_04570 [Thioalkalivibrio halophilus]
MPPNHEASDRCVRNGDHVHLRYSIRPEGELPLNTAGLDADEHEIRLRIGTETPPLPGLDEAVLGLATGQPEELEIPAARAFGERRPELVFEAVRDNLPADVRLEPGLPLYTGDESGRRAWQLRVVELTERGALLDGNHPLAGHPLRIRATVLAIKD